jgi:hypothetical protein
MATTQEITLKLMYNENGRNSVEDEISFNHRSILNDYSVDELYKAFTENDNTVLDEILESDLPAEDLVKIQCLIRRAQREVNTWINLEIRATLPKVTVSDESLKNLNNRIKDALIEDLTQALQDRINDYFYDLDYGNDLDETLRNKIAKQALDDAKDFGY